MKFVHGFVAIAACVYGVGILLLSGTKMDALPHLFLSLYALSAYLQEIKKEKPKNDSQDTSSHEPFADIRSRWQNHYRAQHGMELDLSQVLIPARPDEKKDWVLLCIAQGLTPNREFDSWNFPKWKVQDDLDTLAHKNARNTTKTYFIWVKIGSEPDAEFLGQSTNQADPNMKIGQTLLERLVFQSYAHRIGLVLDKKGSTFCSGSRTSGGRVPYVDLSSYGRVSVCWYDAAGQNEATGVRRAVCS